MDEISHYTVPIDDRWHDFYLTGPILHVAAREILDVEFWAMHHPDMPAAKRRLRVFYTAQPHVGDEFGRLPVYVGTAIDVKNRVWHLMEAVPPPSGETAHATAKPDV